MPGCNILSEFGSKVPQKSNGSARRRDQESSGVRFRQMAVLDYKLALLGFSKHQNWNCRQKTDFIKAFL